MTAYQSTRSKEWGRIVAKAWADDQFKARLLEDSGTILLEHGLELPAGVQVKVVEDSKLVADTDEICHLVLPARPTAELQEEEFAALDATTGPWAGCGFSFRCFRCFRCGGCGRCRCGG